MSRDEGWIKYCMQLARHAQAKGEVPVGAIVVLNDEVIGEGWNAPISACDPTAHAEICVLRQAALKLQNYRLLGATLYVTLEPCMMCAGAIVHARIKRLVFGAFDLRAGAAGSIFNVFQNNQFNHRVDVIGGVLKDECGAMLQGFFQQKRDVS